MHPSEGSTVGLVLPSGVTLELQPDTLTTVGLICFVRLELKAPVWVDNTIQVVLPALLDVIGWELSDYWRECGSFLNPLVHSFVWKTNQLLLCFELQCGILNIGDLSGENM